MAFKAKKFNRVKFDGAYMFAAVFAGVGGLLLLGSYASSKPIETFNQGTYSLAKYATDKPDVFNLGLNSKYNYCLSPIDNEKATTITISNNEGFTKPVDLNVAPDNTVCFNPKENYSKTEVKIYPAPDNSVSIMVQ